MYILSIFEEESILGDWKPRRGVADWRGVNLEGGQPRRGSSPGWGCCHMHHVFQCEQNSSNLHSLLYQKWMDTECNKRLNVCAQSLVKFIFGHLDPHERQPEFGIFTASGSLHTFRLHGPAPTTQNTTDDNGIVEQQMSHSQIKASRTWVDSLSAVSSTPPPHEYKAPCAHARPSAPD